MRKLQILFVLWLASLTGCTYVNPFVSGINIISVPQETQIGQEAAKQISQQMKLVEDSRTTRVRKIGSQLVSVLPRKEFNYQFYVVEDKSPNAFTIPGGAIYVHTGLIDFAADDHELAGVMAHEVGHAYERHPAKAMTRQYGVDALSKIIFSGDRASLQKVAQVAGGTFLLRYGRQDEYEADEVGYLLLKRAGYQTNGLLRFFQKLQKLEKGGSIAFLSSHPPTPDRIARLQAFESGQLVPQVQLGGDTIAVPTSTGLVSKQAAPTQYAYSQNYATQSRSQRKSGARRWTNN